MKNILLLSAFVILNLAATAQTSVGIALIPTGTDVGVGFRSSKTTKWALDARVAKANFYNNPTLSSFTTEASGICRVVSLEKVKFHVGIGVRNEWNIAGKRNKVGGVVPIGVEGFPFPFQNAGVFFEIAPYFVHDLDMAYNAGLRSSAGFVFYFPTKPKTAPTN